MFCRNCGGEMNDNQAVCLKCGVPTGVGNSYCNNCGAEVNSQAVICVKCGVSLVKEEKKPEPVKSPKVYCSRCGTPSAPGTAACPNCGTPLARPVAPTAPTTAAPATPAAPAAPAQRKIFCNQCGAPAAPGTAMCNNCGARISIMSNQAINSVTQKLTQTDQNYLDGKSKGLMALICLMFGGLGVHHFVLGETKRGVMKIILSILCGLGYLFSLIDLYRILKGSYKIDKSKFL